MTNISTFVTLVLSLACCLPAAFSKNTFAPDENPVRDSLAHVHQRAISTKYIYQTIVVDSQGKTIYPEPETSSEKPHFTELDSLLMQEPQSTQTLDSSPTSETLPTSTVQPQVSFSSQNRITLSPSSSESITTPSSAASSTLTSSIRTPTSSEPLTTSSSAASSTSSSSTSSSSSSPVSSGIKGDLNLYKSPTEKFVDGVIPCSEFPAGQGVIPIDWMNSGGWSGIENSDTSTGGACKEGSYCSYACQPGMLKTQWPEEQPEDGRSIGGLLCKGGYLYRSNDRSEYLCEWGVDKVEVVNELNDLVSICTTDYPGTENMVIPTVVGAGSTQPLSVVDSGSYYRWRGRKTSAQFYVNNAGVSPEEGCLWNSEGSNLGNWAPLNFGAGYDNGIAYLSLIPNPNNLTPANFNVKIVPADDQSSISGECYYENGKYNGDSRNGCTVGVTYGKAKFVLYN